MSRLFDGVDDKISYGDVDAIDGAGAMTIDFWTMPIVLTSLDVFVGKVDNSLSTGWVMETGVGGVGDEDDLIASVDGNNYGFTTSNIFANNTWIFLGYIFDGSLTGNANRLKVYTYKPATKTWTQETLTFTGTIPATLPSTTHSLRLGATHDDVRFYNGRLAHVHIATVAYTEGQLRQRLHNPNYRTSSGEVLMAPLNFATEPDWSGSAQTATLTGTSIADNPPVAPWYGYDLGWMGAIAAPAPAGGTWPGYIGGGWF